MEQTKKMLSVSLSICLVLCSLSVFIYSIRHKTVTASTPPSNINQYVPVGIYVEKLERYDIIRVVSYNESAGFDKRIILSDGKKISK